MIKWGLILIAIGASLAFLFFFLPLYHPDNTLSRLMLTPLLCNGGETYEASTVFGFGADDSTTASLTAVCVSASGARRDVTERQLGIGWLAGGVPFFLGAVTFLLRRWTSELSLAVRLMRNPPAWPFRRPDAPSKTPARQENSAPKDVV